MISKIVNTFTKNPASLFLTDSIGAFITSFSLFVVLRNLNAYFSMPHTILTSLSGGAAVLFVYSGACFFFLKRNWIQYIRIIMIANLLYCFLTLAILIFHFYSLTIFDLIYFVGEIMIICSLVFIEFRTAHALSR